MKRLKKNCDKQQWILKQRKKIAIKEEVNMVKVSVTLVTKKREPKFEYAFQSLKNQSFRDFEYVIIDGYYESRKNEVLSLIDRMKFDFPVLYLPEKPSRWKGQRCQISNARNTALIFANGKYIVNHDDCCKMSNNWIERHVSFLDKGYLVAGSWIGYQFVIGNEQGIEGCYGPESRMKLIKEPKEVGAGWFYGANCSYPLEPSLDINGFDEELDGEMGQEDLNLSIRLERKGFKTIYDPLNCVGIYMPTHGYERMIPPINKVLRDGKEHFSNEFVTQRLLSDTGRVFPYGNPFDIKDIRKMVKQYDIIQDMIQIYENMEAYVNPDKHDWRDGRLVEEKIKE